MSRFITMLEDVEITRAEDVAKHGDHDQSEHGNWSTGGGVGYKDSDKHPQFDFNEEDGTNLEYYTNVGSWEINGLLRTGKMPQDSNSSKTEIQNFIESIDKEMAKTSAPRDMVLFRGTSGGKSDSIFGTLKEGDTFIDKGYVSTTAVKEVVTEFMSTATGGRYDSRPVEKGYVLEINVPKGGKVLSVNNYFKAVSGRYGPGESIRKENEHILPRGTKFRVDSVGSVEVREGLKDKLIRVTVVDNEK
jgi:hypothetical protein